MGLTRIPLSLPPVLRTCLCHAVGKLHPFASAPADRLDQEREADQAGLMQEPSTRGKNFVAEMDAEVNSRVLARKMRQGTYSPLPDPTHLFCTAARTPVPPPLPHRPLLRLVAPMVARHNRHSGLGHDALGLTLVTHGPYGVAAGSDEGHSGLLTGRGGGRRNRRMEKVTLKASMLLPHSPAHVPACTDQQRPRSPRGSRSLGGWIGPRPWRIRRGEPAHAGSCPWQLGLRCRRPRQQA